MTAYSVILVVSLIGNILIAAVILSNKKMKKPTNYFILNIPLTVNVAMDAGEVQQVILRNFEFLSEEGPLRKETISMENDLCEQTPIHESYVNGTATCFDINMR